MLIEITVKQFLSNPCLVTLYFTHMPWCVCCVQCMCNRWQNRQNVTFPPHSSME